MSCASLDALDAYVLCGGLGTRLRPLVADRPKVLAEIAGRSLLEILLDLLHRAGLRRFVLCAGYRAEAVLAAVPALRRFGEIEVSIEDEPLGTGGALRRALPCGRSDPFLATNGDTVCPALDLGAMLAFHAQHGAQLTLALARAGDDGEYGAVTLDADQRITGFAEKGTPVAGGHHSAGVYLMDRDWFESRAPGGAFSLENDLFPRCVGDRAFGFPYAGSFLDIGTPDRYRMADRCLRRLGLLPGQPTS
jgi:NDP-sugar pyrophosphorylase family protein